MIVSIKKGALIHLYIGLVVRDTNSFGDFQLTERKEMCFSKKKVGKSSCIFIVELMSHYCKTLRIPTRVF